MSTTASIATEFLTVAEVARRLRVHEATIYRKITSGELPALRLGEHGPLRIPADELEAWLHERPARAPRTGSEPAVEPQAHGGADTEEEA